MNLKDVYNKIAKDWFEDHSNDTWWVEGLHKFTSLLKPNDLVLDVGCGPGTKSKLMLDKGLSVIGVDFSDKMIEIAQKEAPTGDFRVLDIKNIGDLEESFDGILAQAVLLHIPKKEVLAIITGLKNKLKDGGYLYIAVKEQKPGAKEEEILQEKDYGYEYERFFSYFTMPEVKKYLENLKMKICYETLVRAGKTNWIQVIVQK